MSISTGVRRVVLVALVITVFAAQSSAGRITVVPEAEVRRLKELADAKREDHEYVKPINWKKVKVADDEVTRWLEQNVVLWQLANKLKPMVEDPAKFDKLGAIACAFVVCDAGMTAALFDWDEKKVGVTKKQLIALVERGVKKIHADYQKRPGSMRGGTADGASMTWAGWMGAGVWPVWEHLSEDAQRKAVQVFLKEARVFEKRQKTWSYPNSNIEENSAEATFYSLIANMMPEHPLNKKWEQCVRHWTYGHVVSLAELQADPIFSDGTRLRDYVEYKPTWVWFGRLFWYGGSIHDDGSVMNHETVNLHYAMTGWCRYASLMWYNLSGRKPPEGLASIGVKRMRNFFVRMVTPWGSHISPDGYEYTPEYGTLYRPSYYLLYWDPTPEAWAAWQMTFEVGKEIVASGSALPDYRPFGYGDYYPLKLYGDLNKPARIMSPKELMKRLSGVHVAPTAKYVVHRSPEAFSVYSWHGFSANGGLLTRDPVALNTGGDGGGVLVRSKREKDNKSVEDSLGSRSWAKTTVHGPVVEDDGFSIVVRRETKHGITNYTACVSLPGCNTVLVSRTIAEEDMEVDMLRMGRKTFLLKQNPAALAKHGLKKWPWWGDHKIYLPEDKELKFGGSWRRAELNPRPAWVNVGNRMGYVPIGTSPTIGAGGRTIVFECYSESRQIKAGGEIGRIILVTFPGVTAAETARLAAEVRTLAEVPEGVYAVRIPKVRGIAAPVWVVVNFRDEAVNLTLPSKAGGEAKVTVKGNSCATFGLRPTRPPRPARKTLFTRKNYDAVEVGMDKARVKRALGEPTQKFVNVFIYLDEDPMGNAEAHVYFDTAGKVVGKRYDNSAKPAETSRVGNVPK